MINVTKTYFPPLEEYVKQLERIWRNEWLTNRGELAIELEGKLKDFLGVQNVLLMNNGTIPMQIALKVLGEGGEIITTPFSYVATTSAIVWENCKPVFVDIHPEYFTIDERKIEAAITERTTCILATHVFGNPCAVEEIELIARKYGLKVIYDAAHAFGVNYKGKSLFSYGDVSTCSFHATKLFHTGEGGAVFCNDHKLNHQLFYSHNFGHNGPTAFHGLGINGKISELQAAMGLSVLPHIDEIMKNRRNCVEYYNRHINFSICDKIKIREGSSWNYSYYPVLFSSEATLIKIIEKMNDNGINPRRYFYPSLNNLNYVNSLKMPVSEDISSRILCLPLSHDLDYKDLQKVVKVINSHE
ncbi:DegT/DnrJ/EryC1/StrS family aminotransferase [Robertkochia flava]|uniref:DegT/DnrJ/EryC1/StrS family aminotransferase n=1 Tax=Robertkochia flava TaxID=3447986 RepID=UPI001CCDF3BC|nr:DegT/DnrJ/EryC1/StrS family aminotransferase [Robertkochia marina]